MAILSILFTPAIVLVILNVMMILQVVSAGCFCSNPRWRNGTRPKSINSRIEDGRITSKAIQKDTVVVEKNSHVVISFQADNPGYWFMHCHVEEHLLDGMALLIQEYPDSQHWKPPAGINNHGSFQWTIEDYEKTIQASEQCSTGKSIRAANILVLVIATAGVWRYLSNLYLYDHTDDY